MWSCRGFVNSTKMINVRNLQAAPIASVRGPLLGHRSLRMTQYRSIPWRHGGWGQGPPDGQQAQRGVEAVTGEPCLHAPSALSRLLLNEWNSLNELPNTGWDAVRSMRHPRGAWMYGGEREAARGLPAWGGGLLSPLSSLADRSSERAFRMREGEQSGGPRHQRGSNV